MTVVVLIQLPRFSLMYPCRQPAALFTDASIGIADRGRAPCLIIVNDSMVTAFFSLIKVTFLIVVTSSGRWGLWRRVREALSGCLSAGPQGGSHSFVQPTRL